MDSLYIRENFPRGSYGNKPSLTQKQYHSDRRQINSLYPRAHTYVYKKFIYMLGTQNFGAKAITVNFLSAKFFPKHHTRIIKRQRINFPGSVILERRWPYYGSGWDIHFSPLFGSRKGCLRWLVGG
jgi:hypothetical protein